MFSERKRENVLSQFLRLFLCLVVADAAFQALKAGIFVHGFCPGRMNVGIIGAGAAGLICCRRLLLNSKIKRVTILESHSSLGGVWSSTKPDSQLYDGLITNIPMEVMEVHDFPFYEAGITPEKNSTGSSFVSSKEVEDYLFAFAENFGVIPCIKFDNLVERVQRRVVSDNGDEWEVHTRSKKNPDEVGTYTFDALIVCNGHFNKVRFPGNIPLETRKKWKGRILHAKEYKSPNEFSNQTVVVVGARSSGTDIARELSQVASQVHVCDKKCPSGDDDESVTESLERISDGFGWRIKETNLVWRPKLQRIGQNDSLVYFEDGSQMTADAIIFATGYDYDFEFFSSDDDIISVVEGKMVQPVYMQIQHREYPSLFFPGLPFDVAPFPLLDVQAAWISNSIKSGLTKSTNLPDPFAPEDIPDQGLAHSMRHGKQWEYCEYLANECGLERNKEKCDKAIEIYNYVSTKRPKLPGAPDDYRYLNFSSGPPKDGQSDF